MKVTFTGRENILTHLSEAVIAAQKVSSDSVSRSEGMQEMATNISKMVKDSEFSNFVDSFEKHVDDIIPEGSAKNKSLRKVIEEGLFLKIKNSSKKFISLFLVQNDLMFTIENGALKINDPRMKLINKLQKLINTLK